MRKLAMAILALATVSGAGPAAAQTYDPAYPVCLHVYGRITYWECRYTSLAQCAGSASGRAAQCEINPYYAGTKPRRQRQHPAY
jgi:glycerol uptake facilitator-like aquaporin